MSEIFISYARSTAPQAEAVADALRADGYSIWKDDALPAHRAYSEVIEERLRAANAVVVLWSADAVKSQWVRAEADLARSMGTLVQLNLDGCTLPLPFNQIASVDLIGWDGSSSAPSWNRAMASVAALVGNPAPSQIRAELQAEPARSHSGVLQVPAAPKVRQTLLAVLAFDNKSNDPELTYFSDGVSEEILYTVAGIRGLRVIGRASSFQFRGADKSVHTVGAALGATHILDGSVRRAGNRLRIHVELVDTASQTMLWTERYDRDLTDIFALQDEIAAAIAVALDHHFVAARVAAPVDPKAYDLYLQARAIYAQDLDWAAQARCVALLAQVVEIDPDFALAWGFLGLYRRGDDAVAAANRSLELDPDCATAMVAVALTLPRFGQHARKLALARRAYELAPDEQVVAGTYSLLLVATGFLTSALAVSAARIACDPLSPMIAGGHAVLLRSLGRGAEASALAETNVGAFPDSGYARFISALIALFDGDIDRASAISASAADAGHALPLEVLLMFMKTVAGMDAEARRSTVHQFLHRNAPTSYLVDICLASAMGEADLAMVHLLEVVRDGRPLEFTADNDGRAAGNDVAVTSALFMPNGEILRRDPRFAEICVRLGLYACWQQLGQWPDCAAELAPFYDLKAECAKRAAEGIAAQPASDAR